MLVKNILGNINNFEIETKDIDEVAIEWYEVNKRILKKQSKKGVEVGIKLEQPYKLQDGDILFLNERKILIVSIIPCDTISIIPENMKAMGKICYEIGNKHIPLFFYNNEVLVNYDEPLMRLLEKEGFKPEKTVRKLVDGLKQHSHSHEH
ncbi:urease accessory protein UreE [Clostridium tyrobutyricum]|uniref:urease accessory protein UreE n=1 Tax=Clostridium tyrobutyricum TaxID=1519 RepID=UPI0002D95212|nr:urease accessory protein UreE [Clostridium tyrobutyricum]